LSIAQLLGDAVTQSIISFSTPDAMLELSMFQNLTLFSQLGNSTSPHLYPLAVLTITCHVVHAHPVGTNGAVLLI
jgi:hypothetical protein